jgi:ABC-type multidrug transport system permease subunit
MISSSVLLSMLVTLVIGGLIFYLLWWFLGYIGLPAPFDKVARVIIGLCALVFLIDLLLGLSGHPIFRW